MKKLIYDENGLWYELQDDYYLPCLKSYAEKEHRPIGIWGTAAFTVYQTA